MVTPPYVFLARPRSDGPGPGGLIVPSDRIRAVSGLSSRRLNVYERHSYGHSERRFSTGLPIGVMAVSMMAIAAYLFVGSALLDDGGQATAIVLPKPVVASAN